MKKNGKQSPIIIIAIIYVGSEKYVIGGEVKWNGAL